ncbi:hypothetical protein ACFWH4_31370 [Streptomyces sp. NPDC127091]|uniref:hypothetical protein n=1 Tax=Streptomyces sp. NPDC127091 TaxID=3347134 RepID=UPI00365F6AB1
MSTTSATTDDLLHALRIKGLSAPAVLAALSGIEQSAVADATAPLVESGLVLLREGRMGGYLLTAEGRTRADAVVAERSAAEKDALAPHYDDFLQLNGDFKRICQSWQMRDAQTPNDHTDTDYDGQVIAALATLHGKAVAHLVRLSSDVARYERYVPRLTEALGRVQGGDNASFARPMYDSYHDIWMELHQDLILALGRERSAADEGH